MGPCGPSDKRYEAEKRKLEYEKLLKNKGVCPKCEGRKYVTIFRKMAWSKYGEHERLNFDCDLCNSTGKYSS